MPWSCARRSRPFWGGWGRCRLLCLPRFPLPAPPFLRCLWQDVPSGCSSSLLAGTPFHAVCAFRGLGPVALLVFPPGPLCLCALALLRRPRPSPPLPRLMWRTDLARSRCLALVGPFHSVHAPPRVLPPSRAPFCLLWGAAARSRFPLPGFGLHAPRGLGAGVGTCHQPYRARSCELTLRAGLARCRGGTRAPVGGASCLGVGRPASGAVPPPTTRYFGRAAGAQYPLAVGAGAAGVGTRHEPQSARSCKLALRPVGAAQGGPGGGASGLGVGRPGSGALPPPTTRPFGRAAGAQYPLAVGAGAAGVGTRHQPHSARSCERPLRAVAAACGCLVGRLLPGCGASGVGRSPNRDHSPQRALLRAGFELWGGHEGAWGGRLLPGCGASGVGRSPTPTTPPFGRAAGAHYALAVDAGGLGVGTHHQPHSARSCELALGAVGAA